MDAWRLQKSLRPRSQPIDLQIGLAIPIGCMVPLAIAAAALVGAGVFVGTRLGSQPAPDHVVVRVIDDGAAGGPTVIATQVIPLDR